MEVFGFGDMESLIVFSNFTILCSVTNNKGEDKHKQQTTTKQTKNNNKQQTQTTNNKQTKKDMMATAK